MLSFNQLSICIKTEDVKVNLLIFQRLVAEECFESSRETTRYAAVATRNSKAQRGHPRRDGVGRHTMGVRVDSLFLQDGFEGSPTGVSKEFFQHRFGRCRSKFT